MRYILSILFVLLLTFRSYAGTGDFSHRHGNSPDKSVIISIDSSDRRKENSPDTGNFSDKKPEILEEKSSEKISEISVTEGQKSSEKKLEILEEKSSEKVSEISDRRLKNSDNEEIKNQDINNYNTYNVTPDMPGYWNTRGDSFFYDRRYTEAIECYVKALKINPSSKELDDKIEKSKILLNNLGVYLKNSENTTILHSKINNFYDVKALVYNGADINAANIYGDTPLHCLAGSNDYNTDRLDTARFLIEHGASINAQDNEGNSPLHNAAENGLYSVVELLINRGANIDMRNFYGYTPLDLAILWGREDTVRLLLKYGAK
jgi:ankyrin repeat protein